MKKLIGVFTGLVLSLVLAFVITKPQTVNADSTILPGVSINGIDVSGLDEAGAQAKLDEYLNGLSTASITFKISDTELGYSSLYLILSKFQKSKGFIRVFRFNKKWI